MKNRVKIPIIATCVLVACMIILGIVSHFLFIESIDVAKRIQSPDQTKTALLIRRYAFIDLNFVVKIKSGFFAKTLHLSKDFDHDHSRDWNEKIIWSDDSTFLVMMVDDPLADNKIYMWAYDFKNNREYLNSDSIINILSSRSCNNTILEKKE